MMFLYVRLCPGICAVFLSSQNSSLVAFLKNSSGVFLFVCWERGKGWILLIKFGQDRGFFCMSPWQ